MPMRGNEEAELLHPISGDAKGEFEMKASDFASCPIVRPINPNTGLLEGDDSGYRKVPICPLDNEDPDPMEEVTTVATLPVYAKGETEGLCCYYPGGIGGPERVLVRAPVARGLEEADQMLKPLGRKLLVVDGFRPYTVQAALWRYLRGEIITARGLKDNELTLRQEVEVGLKADDVGSYCALSENLETEGAITGLMSNMLAEIHNAATALGKDAREVATLFVTFQANLGRNALKLQEDAITAHGNGGAVDLWMVDDRGKFCNLGVPYDYVPPPNTDISPAVINYFEMVEYEHYEAIVARDPTLNKYLAGLAKEVTRATFEEARRERRILFHAMMSLGGTYFSLDKDLGEPWHFQLGNERQGKQSMVAGLEGSGNCCHAKLKGISQAVWSNAVGHKLAHDILGKL